MSQETSLSELDLESLIELRHDVWSDDSGDPNLSAIDAEIARRGIPQSVHQDDVPHQEGCHREYHNSKSETQRVERAETQPPNASQSKPRRANASQSQPSNATVRPSKPSKTKQPNTRQKLEYYGIHDGTAVASSKFAIRDEFATDDFLGDDIDGGSKPLRTRVYAIIRWAVDKYLSCEGNRRYTLERAVSRIKSIDAMAAREAKDLEWVLHYWLRRIERFASKGVDVDRGWNALDFREAWRQVPPSSSNLASMLSDLDFTGVTDDRVAILMICDKLSELNKGERFILGQPSLAEYLTNHGFPMSQPTANRRLKKMVDDKVLKRAEDPDRPNGSSTNWLANEYTLGPNFPNL